MAIESPPPVVQPVKPFRLYSDDEVDAMTVEDAKKLVAQLKELSRAEWSQLVQQHGSSMALHRPLISLVMRSNGYSLKTATYQSSSDATNEVTAIMRVLDEGVGATDSPELLPQHSAQAGEQRGNFAGFSSDGTAAPESNRGSGASTGCYDQQEYDRLKAENVVLWKAAKEFGDDPATQAVLSEEDRNAGGHPFPKDFYYVPSLAELNSENSPHSILKQSNNAKFASADTERVQHLIKSSLKTIESAPLTNCKVVNRKGNSETAKIPPWQTIRRIQIKAHKVRYNAQQTLRCILISGMAI